MVVVVRGRVPKGLLSDNLAVPLGGKGAGPMKKIKIKSEKKSKNQKKMFQRQLSRRVGASAWARGRSGGPRGGPRASSALNACARAPAAFSTSGAFGKLTRRELQQLAKAHSVRANMKSVEIVAALEDLGVKPPTSSPEPPAFESAPSKTSAHQPGAATSKFSWPREREDDAIDMSDARRLAPADLEPANRRVIKPIVFAKLNNYSYSR